MAFQQPALATDISSGSTVKASGLGSGTATFKGGTLSLDSATTVSNAIAIQNYASNTIDIDGHAATMSGVFSGAGPITFTDSVGGGVVTLTNSANTYTGETTINSGAVLALSGSGTIATSSDLVDNGTFDISATTSGASLTSLSGAGTIALGGQTLSLTTASGTYSGTITGSGNLTLSSGTEILAGNNSYSGGTTIAAGSLQIGDGGTTGSIVGNVQDNGSLSFDRTDNITFGGIVSGTGGLAQIGSGVLTLSAANTYSGTTSISTGTLALSAGGSIANSSVAVAGTFDVSALSTVTIKSLTGSGTVDLGAATLTLTNASGNFTGTVAGTGTIVVSGGTFGIGASTFTGNVTDNATVGFQGSSATINFSGVISGTGNVEQISGATVITSAQTYSGSTLINAGTLTLQGNGSIANTSSVEVGGIFSIGSANADVTIPTLSGTGSVQLGATDLTLSNASDTFSGVISGSGNVTLLGGKETLSGLNTFTGETIISGGTLAIGNPQSLIHSSVVDNSVFDISQSAQTTASLQATIVSLSGSGSVILGQNTLVLNAPAATFSGTISGTGGLTINSGIETLTGPNTYTGDTTIKGGTLALSGSGSLLQSTAMNDSGVLDLTGLSAGSTVTFATLSGSGTVALGHTNMTLNDADSRFTGVITGSGALTISGGSEILTGVNSYTGGTVISAGSLQIGDNYSSGAIVGDVSDDGVLAFNNPGTSTVSGTISGSGAFVQEGTGTTILTGTDTYSGGTTISAGTLQIGAGGTAGMIAGSVVDNGTLAFGRSDTISFGGTISGTGGITVLSGTTILTAAEQYSGATVVDTLANLSLTGAASIAPSSGVTVNGGLDLSGLALTPQLASLSGAGTVTMGTNDLVLTNGTGNFSGSISGTGGLTVTGGSGQVLSGTNAYSGQTNVNGGVLAVNGSITSSSGVSVGSGGTLAGSGKVGTVSVASGGALAPGYAGTGKLTVDGSVVFASGSKFVIDTASGSAGTLAVTGSAALNGTISIASLDGSYPVGQKITVLTAGGGVMGSFAVAPISSTGAQFATAVSYDANDVYLEVNLAKLSPLLPTGSTRNEINSTGGIDAAIAAGDTLPIAFQDLGTLTSATYQADAGQFASEVAGDLPQAGQSLFDPFVTTIFDHVANLQPTGMPHSGMPQDRNFWASGFIGTERFNAQDGAIDTHEMHNHVTGFTLGGDWNVTPGTMLGFALSTGSADFQLSDGFGRGRVRAFQLGFYGLMQYSRHLYGSFAVAAAQDDARTTRTIDVSGTDTLEGKPNGRIFGGRYETGVELGWITPYVSVQDALYDATSAKETASAGSATFALSYKGHTTNFANAELGFRQRVDVPLDDWVLKLSDRIAWRHDMSGTPAASAAFAALPDSTFNSYGASTGRDAGLASIGATLASPSGFSFGLRIDTDVSGKSQAYTEAAQLNYTW